MAARKKMVCFQNIQNAFCGKSILAQYSILNHYDSRIPNGRRFSPLTIVLLLALIFYSLILLKRIRKQQGVASQSKILVF